MAIGNSGQYGQYGQCGQCKGYKTLFQWPGLSAMLCRECADQEYLGRWLQDIHSRLEIYKKAVEAGYYSDQLRSTCTIKDLVDDEGNYVGTTPDPPPDPPQKTVQQDPQ